MIESWFRSLKTDQIYINEYRNQKELRAAINGYIDNHNKLRLHEALVFATPERPARPALQQVTRRSEPLNRRQPQACYDSRTYFNLWY